MQPPPAASAPAILVASDLMKRFGRLVAVDGISLTVRGGEIFALVGPNGAGKTTTVNMCTGLLRPSAGLVTISGLDVQRHPAETKRLLGYVPDEPYVYDKLTAREFVTYMGDLYGVTGDLRERVEELLAYFGLSEVADSLIGGYSHGMKQKTGLCGVLIHDPLVVFLDEPTVGLDPKSARLLKNTLQSLAAEGRAVIICTHILEIAEAICHRVGIVDRGRIIAEGSVEELRTMSRAANDASLEDIFLRLTGDDVEEEVVEALLAP